MILKASEIRLLFAKCLERKLDGDKYQSRDLSTKIIDYLRMETVYSMKRLMKADQKLLHKDDSQISSSKTKQKSSKSADFMTDFLNIGSIRNLDDESGASEYLAKKWTCDVCGEDFYFTLPAKLEHIEFCKSEGKVKSGDSNEFLLDYEKSNFAKSVEESGTSTLKKHYFCETCNCQLYLTPTEILKHKRSHKSEG